MATQLRPVPAMFESGRQFTGALRHSAAHSTRVRYLPHESADICSANRSIIQSTDWSVNQSRCLSREEGCKMKRIEAVPLVKKLARTALVGIFTGLSATAAVAQEFPSGAIRLVVPFAPGSSTDAFARVMGDEFKKATGVTVVVENKAGANGLLAGGEVARAKPDGYTLLLATSSTHSAAPYIFKSVPYDPVADFTPVALLITGQNILTATASLPVNTAPELVAYAKQRPGELKYSTHNSSTVVSTEVFKSIAGINVVQVPYKKIGDAVNDLISGRVQMAILDQFNAAPLIAAGTIKGLAVTGLKRSELVPNIPTFHESGIALLQTNVWVGIAGPKGMPRSIVEKMNATFGEILRKPDVLEKLKGFGYSAAPTSTDDFLKFIKDQSVVWKEATGIAGIVAQ